MIMSLTATWELEGIKMFFRMLADSENSRTVQVEREIRTATGDSETLLLTPVGDNLFRVEESSFVTAAVYRVIASISSPNSIPAMRSRSGCACGARRTGASRQ
jgi:hypothetical protein